MHTHKQQTGSGSNGASSRGNLGAGLDSHTDMAAASLRFVVEGTAPVCQKTRPIPPDCTRAYARVYHPTEETKNAQARTHACVEFACAASACEGATYNGAMLRVCKADGHVGRLNIYLFAPASRSV